MGEPCLLLIGGVNGAGKSTLARKLLPKYGITRFLNADEIARGLSPMDSTAAALRAGRLLLQEAKDLIAAKSSFALESTLSGKGHARLLSEAKKAEFRIFLHYVMLDSAEEAIGRVGLRVSLGGHHVPEDDVERRFHRSRRMLLELYAPLADEWFLWDNSIPPAREVANSSRKNPDELKEIMESSRLRETAADTQPDGVRKGLEASREATEEMLEYYRRMGVKVTPQMTLANPDEDIWVPRGVL